jgi:hypothetical protein
MGRELAEPFRLGRLAEYSVEKGKHELSEPNGERAAGGHGGVQASARLRIRGFPPVLYDKQILVA